MLLHTTGLKYISTNVFSVLSNFPSYGIKNLGWQLPVQGVSQHPLMKFPSFVPETKIWTIESLCCFNKTYSEGL